MNYFVFEFHDTLRVCLERTQHPAGALGADALGDPSFVLWLMRGRVPQNGTGNTGTAATFIEPLFEAAFVSRMLFVADGKVQQVAKQSFRGADSAVEKRAHAARKEAARRSLQHLVERVRMSRRRLL